MTAQKQILIAKVLTAHGVRGFVKLRCFLEDPHDIEDYAPIVDAKGKSYKITLKNSVKGDWVASINNLTDRNDAELLKGIELFVNRDQLPEAEDGEIYIEDLIGLTCINAKGEKLGEVIDFQNFGAGDLLEIKPVNGGKTYYLPMVEPYVGEFDLDAGTILIDPAEEFMA